MIKVEDKFIMDDKQLDELIGQIVKIGETEEVKRILAENFNSNNIVQVFNSLKIVEKLIEKGFISRADANFASATIENSSKRLDKQVHNLIIHMANTNSLLKKLRNNSA